MRSVPPSTRLVIVDHCLLQADGHSMTLARAALDYDPTVEVWANVNCTIEEPRVRHVFPHSNMHPDVRFPSTPAEGVLNRLRFFASIVQRVVRANHSFARVLDAGGNSPTIWFVVNGSVRNAFALLWRCSLHPADTGVCYLLQDPGRWLKFVEGARRMLGIRNFHFAAETTEMAGNAARMMGGHCEVLPFPVSGVEQSPPSLLSGRPLVAGFLGMPRREKGFDILAQAVRLLAEETRIGSLGFRLQAPKAYLEQEGMAAELANLQSMTDAGHAIECFEGNLDCDAYRALLQSCDFLVIPYRTAAYALRSSLIPIEGLLHGKPLVMTHGLLVSASLPSNAGVVEFADGDADHLAKAIREMLTTYNNHASKVRGIDAAWRRRYTPEGFVRTLRKWSENRTDVSPVAAAL